MTGRTCVSVALASLYMIATPRVGHAETISLKEALRRAEKHPKLQLAEGTVDVSRGKAKQAGTILFNPQVSAGMGPRFTGDSTLLDVTLGLAQTFELGGKRRYRAAAADKRVTVARAGVGLTRQLVTLRVRRAYAMALVARARVEAASDGHKVAADLATTATQRLAQGVGTQLEVNLAAASVGRALQQRAVANQGYTQATVELAAAVGGVANKRLEPEPGPLGTGALTASEQSLVSRALDGRAELKMLDALTAVAAAQTRLADSLAVPNLGVGVNYARDERQHQVLLSLSVSLPVWNRNRGGRRAARAVHRRAKTRAWYQRREVDREVRAAYARYQIAQSAIVAFQQQAVGNLRKNLALTQEAFLKGKISIIDFNLLRRQFVDVRLAYLSAVGEGILARYALERAIGGGL